MQKVFNLFSTVSFVGVLAIVGAGGYVYVNRETITENVKTQVMEAVTGAISEQLGDLGSLGGGGIPAPSSPAGSGLPVPF